MMAASLFPSLRYLRKSILLQDPVIQIFFTCPQSGLHYDVCLNNSRKTLSTAKSLSASDRIENRLRIVLEQKTFPKVVGEATKVIGENRKGNTKSQDLKAVSVVAENIRTSNIANLQVKKYEPEDNAKSTKFSKKPSSLRQNSSKVVALGYVRKCCPYNPLDQVRCDLNGDHSKYKKFVDNLSLRSIPSVTSIINLTMPDSARYFLNRWKQRMIQELGTEGFALHQEKTLGLGRNLHSCIQKHLEGVSKDDLPLEADNQGHWNSLASVFPDISDVRALEVNVSHQTLMYHGKFDCVARYRDMLCVIDWKTSKKAKPSLSNTYDNPIQLAAYLGAINSSNVMTGEQDSKLRQCALVIAYPQGDPAHVHIMDCDQVSTYWDKWLDRLELYWVLKSNNKLPERI
ncbi:mitochondrial genome maintenance exonuclease 1-like [Ylistrum balloti]|uniref:mitochondrial genome maintenance exonuclease 1-like n=1 Tax=Ylistrum balloti TaxID=509963 RepID=UPI002905BA10|nr:mitochondrial genome maintenance exonuclease 1-like [Ylistrum balloti]